MNGSAGHPRGTSRARWRSSGHMWPELLHLARLVPRGCPALPFIFVPAFRNAAFEILSISRQHFLRLFKNIVDSILLFHSADPTGKRTVRVILQNSSRTRLAGRYVHDTANGQIAEDIACKSL